MGRVTRSVDRAPRTSQASLSADRDVSRSSSVGGRRSVSVLSLAICGLVGLSCSTGIAGAHLPPESGGPVAGLAAIVATSVAVSLFGGLVLVGFDRSQQRRPASRLGLAFGVSLFVSGVLAVCSAALDGPALAVVGALTGALLVRLFPRSPGSADHIRRGGDEPHRSAGAHHASAALGAVVAHRAIEGLTVAAVYTTGSAIGVLGAVVLAGHATAETVAVGGLHLADRTRALVAVCLVQVGFVVGVGAGQVATISLSPPHRITVLAVVGGVLLVVGGTETRARLRSGSPLDPS